MRRLDVLHDVAWANMRSRNSGKLHVLKDDPLRRWDFAACPDFWFKRPYLACRNAERTGSTLDEEQCNALREHGQKKQWNSYQQHSVPGSLQFASIAESLAGLGGFGLRAIDRS